MNVNAHFERKKMKCRAVKIAGSFLAQQFSRSGRGPYKLDFRSEIYYIIFSFTKRMLYENKKNMKGERILLHKNDTSTSKEYFVALKFVSTFNKIGMTRKP